MPTKATKVTQTTGIPARRVPEPNVETYVLGHYEQMQFDLAIAYVLAQTSEEQRELEEYVDRTTLRTLQHIFGAHGTVTVQRFNDEETY